MKSTSYLRLFSIVSIFWSIPTLMNSQSTAIYDFSISTVWNATDHSDNGNIPLPSSDHWSDLVGATHNTANEFFEFGTTVSQGIEDVAERGVNTEFNNEVNTAIGNGSADQWLQMAFSPFDAISSSTLNMISVSEDYPFLSLISMIAPSPDWFIGINSYSLLDNEGNWKDTFTMDLFGYDAGTEDGNTYTTSNDPSDPQGVITSLTNIPPFNDQKLGVLTITLISILGIDDVSWNDGLVLYPNPTTNELLISNHSNREIIAIKIYNPLGKLVARSPDNKKVDISSLQSGVYFVKLTSKENEILVKKIVKN